MINAIRADFLFSRGQKEASTGDWAKSIAYYDRALALNPKNSGIYLHKALSLSGQNNGPTAIDAIKAAIELHPENFANYLFQGVIYFDLGDYDNAASNFEMALDLAPDNSLLKCYAALTMLHKNENISGAFDILAANIQNSNSECKARFALFCEGFLLKHKEIARSFEDLYFEKMYAGGNRSRTHILSGLVDKLSILYIHISGIFNKNTRQHNLHHFAARQKLNEGDPESAIKELTISLQFSHQFNEAFDDLISIFFYRKDYQSVFDSINRLEEFEDVKKWTFDLVHQPKENIQTLTELKNHVQLALVIGLYYYYTEDYKKGHDVFSVIKDNFADDFHISYYLGQACLGLGDSEKALVFFREAFQQLHNHAAEMRLEELMRVSKIVSGVSP